MTSTHEQDMVHNVAGRSEESSSEFSCTKCKRLFAYKRSLQLHMRLYCHGLRAIQCTECNQSFAHKYSLEKHVRLNCGKKRKSWICDKCKCPYYKQASFLKHIASCSGSFTCSFCKQTYSSKSYLQKHKK